MKRLGDTTAFRLRQLDAMMHASRALGNAIDQLPRESLQALADRINTNDRRSSEQLRRSLKHNLIAKASDDSEHGNGPDEMS